jgi:hypothetical protein
MAFSASVRSPRAWLRWVTIGLLTAAGLAVGVAGSFLHRAARPGGIALALVAAVGLMILARAVARSRVGLGIVGAAWLVPVVVFSGATSAGDVVVVGDAVGLTFLFGGVLAISVIVGLGVARPTADGHREVPHRGPVS